MNRYTGLMVVSCLFIVLFSSTVYSFVYSQCNSYGIDTTSATSVAFTPSFSTAYATDGGSYVVCPGCAMRLTNIGAYNMICTDGYNYAMPANLIVWTYQGATKKAQTYSGIRIASYQRDDVIGSSSSTGGAEILNQPYCVRYVCITGNFNGCGAYCVLCGSASMNVYSFVESNYTVYVDFIKTFCFDPYNGAVYCSGYNPSANLLYSCPWLGGNLARSNVCYNYEGWAPQREYDVFVPRPGIGIEKPVDQLDASESVVLSWNIENNGVGKETIRMTRNCGNWTCAFVGYTENSPITLNEGEAYAVVMNVTVPAASSKNVGITVSYDDGYGLSCISAKSASSLVNVTASSCPNISIDIEAPAEVLTPKGSAILMGWNVTNNCDADLVLNFSRACDTWNCSFVGYTEGANVNLSKGALYPVRMSVDYSAADYHKNVGIKITYANANPLCAGVSENSSYVYVSIPHIF